MNDLTKKTTVIELCTAFREAEATVRRTFAELVDAEQRVNAIFAVDLANSDDRYDAHAIRIHASNCHHDTDFAEVERVVGAMRRSAWRAISERLELTRIMSVARSKEHEEWLDKGPMPPLTEDEVEAFVRRFIEDMGDMFNAAVKEVFEWLRPRGYVARELKTNQKNATFELGPKIILPSTAEAGYGRERWHINYTDRPRFIALENVFSILDGRGAVSKTYRGELCDAVAASQSGVGETTWFRFRCCKNRNLHLEFKRLDLLKKINELAGGLVFKPETEAA